MSRLIRTWIHHAAYAAFFARHRPGRGVRVILLYHSIGSASPLAEPTPLFQREARYLAKWFHVVRLSEFLSIADRYPDRNVACVTFDDGYVDNATAGRGILEAAGIPGTFFVVTGRLGQEFQTSGGPFRLMTPPQVKALVAAGHEVGAHTVTHRRLTDIPTDLARNEIAGAKRYLEDLLGTDVTSFSYPKGRLNPEVRQLVSDAGYRQAVISRPRATISPPIDPLALPRVAVADYVRAMIRR